jgi:hypothetical protein
VTSCRESRGFVNNDSYISTVAFLIDEMVRDQVLAREALVLAAPPWFVRRLAAETDAETLRTGDGMDLVYVAATPVVGVADLDRQPLGRFVIQDVLDGGFYRLPFYCHPEIDPAGWRSLSLAVRDGLHPGAALTLAAMDL